MKDRSEALKFQMARLDEELSKPVTDDNAREEISSCCEAIKDSVVNIKLIGQALTTLGVPSGIEVVHDCTIISKLLNKISECERVILRARCNDAYQASANMIATALVVADMKK